MNSPTTFPTGDSQAAAAPLDAPATGWRSLRAEMREMIVEVWRFRGLLWQLTLRDLRLRYKQAIMGIGWALFMPVLIVGSGALIKYAMAQVGGVEVPLSRLAAMALKSLPWAFFVGAIGFAVVSLVSNMNLVTKIYFPREVLPLSTVLTQCVDSALGASVLTVILFTVAEVQPSWQVLWVFPLVAMIFLFTAMCALLLSCANLFFRDVKYIVQVILTFGIFFTPVFYEPELLGPRGSWLIMLNPLAPLLEGLDVAVIDRHNLLEPLMVQSKAGVDIMAWHPLYLLYSAIWSIGGFFLAWLIFHKLEFVYAEYI
jgi:ABC-type polysaccharide/polyol phosphate export permease